jgi:hypothetical protein
MMMTAGRSRRARGSIHNSARDKEFRRIQLIFEILDGWMQTRLKAAAIVADRRDFAGAISRAVTARRSRRDNAAAIWVKPTSN